jgi:hypothetical protein
MELLPLVVFCAFLGAWSTVSLLGQILPRYWTARQRSLGWFIPEWRFFAPNPAVHDYLLWIRTRNRDGDLSPVHTQVLRNSSHGQGFWNPGGRRHKIMRDLIDSILISNTRYKVSADLKSDSLPDWVPLSDPYLLLLSYSQGLAPAEVGGHLQFGVVAISQFTGSNTQVFISRWHRLDLPCLTSRSNRPSKSL